MKNKIYKLFTLASVIALIACDSEQAGQDVSAVGSVENYPTPTFSFDGPTTVNEGSETVLTYTVTFDKPIDRPIDFVLVQTGGDATLHEDFDFVNTSVPAYETSADLEIIIYNDDVIEGSETLTFEVQRGTSLANKYLIHPETVWPEPVTVTIENFESEDLTLSFNWEKDIMYDGDPYSACSNIDMDVYVSTEPFDINDPWTNVIEDYSAATGSCPEEWTLSEWEDGNYYFFVDVYGNEFAGLGTDTVVPVTVTALQGGVWEETFTQTDEEAFNSDSEAGTYNDLLFMLTIENGEYTVTPM